MKKLIITFLLLTATVFPQNYKVTGSVNDMETGIPLPFANIMIEGTTRGTATNLEGKFSISLNEGHYELIFSYVGYKPQSVSVQIPSSSSLQIKLEPEAVKLQEVVVNANEDPAYRIIREAIKRKKQNKAGLVNFEYDSYAKNILISAGEVSFVEELFTKGYNKINKWEKELVLSKHRTENVKKNVGSFNQNITGKYYIDFSADTLSIIMNKIILPLADDAFDYYDYKLLKILEYADGVKYLIQVIPRSKIQPLLKGEILIDDGMYALNEVHLSSNEGVIFPYINNLAISFEQQLGKYGNYYLPYYVKTESSLEVNFGGLFKVEKVSLEQINVITNYIINGLIPDSISAWANSNGTKKLKINTKVLTRTEIDSLRPIPLTSEEIKAYAELDSTKSLESRIKVSGPLASLVSVTGEGKRDTSKILYAGILLLSKTYFRDNRVDGLVLGASHSDNIFNNKLNFAIAAGYSFDRKKLEGNLKLNWKAKTKYFNNLKISLFHEPKQWQLMNTYPDIINSAGVLLGFEDQFNYYLSSGFSFGIEKKFGDLFSTRLEYIWEKEKSIPEIRYTSIFRANRFVRTNPEITEGLDSKFSLSITAGNDPQQIQITPQSGLTVQADISNPAVGSDFNYKKVRFIGQVRTNTIYKELLVSPYILFMIEGGAVFGDYGPQHIITPNSALGIYSPFGTLKLLKPYQYVGDKMLALHVEHKQQVLIL